MCYGEERNHCLCFHWNIPFLKYLATAITILLVFCDFFAAFQNSPTLQFYSQSPISCQTAALSRSVGHVNTALACASSSFPTVDRLSSMKNEDDLHHMNHALLHPSEFSANTLHNFAPVYAPSSSLAKETGYPWWAIGGIDGNSAIVRAKGLYLLQSIDGFNWKYANDGKPICVQSDLKYHKFYHSAYDGQNRILYDAVLDIFFLFTRANVGEQARSWQRTMSRDMKCFTKLIPILTTYYNDWCGQGDQGEQFYTHSTFVLPKLYPGVMFALPRRHESMYGGSSSLVHSYDHGASWKRTSLFEPYMAPSEEELENYGVLRDYLLEPFGAIYNAKENSIDYYNLKERKNVEIWRATLLGTKKALNSPRLAGITIPPINKITFQTYPINFYSQCILYIDYEGTMPQVSLLDINGGQDACIITNTCAVNGYELQNSHISTIDGKVSWSQSNTIQKRKQLPSRRKNSTGYILQFSGTDYTLYHVYCKSKLDSNPSHPSNSNNNPNNNPSSHNPSHSKASFKASKAEEYAQQLLRDKIVHLNPSKNYYRKSHASKKNKNEIIFHPFWIGRNIQSIYFLDDDMINKESIQGGVVSLSLARPSTIQLVYKGIAETHAVYPVIVDITPGNALALEIDTANIAPTKRTATKKLKACKNNNQGNSDNSDNHNQNRDENNIWLFQNMYPEAKLNGGGHDHAHDYYNFVSLYVSEKPLHNNSKWSVPKVVADVQYKNFCAGQDWNCVLGFGLHSFREDALTHMLTIAYLDSLFLYAALIPFIVYGTCFGCSKNLQSGEKLNYIIFALKVNLLISFFIMVSYYGIIIRTYSRY